MGWLGVELICKSEASGRRTRQTDDVKMSTSFGTFPLTDPLPGPCPQRCIEGQVAENTLGEPLRCQESVFDAEHISVVMVVALRVAATSHKSVCACRPTLAPSVGLCALRDLSSEQQIAVINVVIARSTDKVLHARKDKMVMAKNNFYDAVVTDTARGVMQRSWRLLGTRRARLVESGRLDGGAGPRKERAGRWPDPWLYQRAAGFWAAEEHRHSVAAILFLSVR